MNYLNLDLDEYFSLYDCVLYRIINDDSLGVEGDELESLVSLHFKLKKILKNKF